MSTSFIIARTLLGFGAVLPLLMIGSSWLVPFDQLNGYAQWVFGVGWLITAVFVVYAWAGSAVPIEKRALWIVVLLLANLLALPFFWFWYVRSQDSWCSRYKNRERVPSA
jgi:hypothetical protein